MTDRPFVHTKQLQEQVQSFEILDSAPTKFQLKLKEAMYINWEKPNLNRQVHHSTWHLRFRLYFLYFVRGGPLEITGGEGGGGGVTIPKKNSCKGKLPKQKFLPAVDP